MKIERKLAHLNSFAFCFVQVYSSNFADLDILCSGSSPRRSLESRDPIAVANKAWLLQAGTMDHRRLS